MRTASALALLTLGLVSAFAAPALADRNLSADAAPDSGLSPITITNCDAWAGLTTPSNGSNYVRVRIRFFNHTKTRADAVRFSIAQYDAFGQSLGSSTSDEIGDVTSGHYTFDGIGEFDVMLTSSAPNVAKILCDVDMVHFKDSTAWKRGQPPGLYYPPTPSPTP